jgi:hypothetical protein
LKKEGTMAPKKFIPICLAASILICLIGYLHHQSAKRNEYFYTMEMINKDHRFGDIIEIHGKAQGPFKQIIPIEIAGEGDGTLSWNENGTPRKKKYEVVVGYKTYVTTYEAKNGDAIHVVTRAKDIRSKESTNKASQVTSQ